jgi:hypothetical protein
MSDEIDRAVNRKVNQIINSLVGWLIFFAAVRWLMEAW